MDASTSQYVVDGTPAECADAAEGFFALRWPYGGNYSRNGNALNVTLFEEVSQGRDFLEFVMTLGWGGAEGAKLHEASLTFVPDAGNTVMVMRANNPEWRSTLEAWARGDLNARPA